MRGLGGRVQPVFYIPHGGGPCFFMEWTMGPPDTWKRMELWLRQLVSGLPERPKALVVISAHWEEPVVTVQSGARPPMLYDYGGFPPHTYELQWPAPGDPALAERIAGLLRNAGIDVGANDRRGFDHGVFVPLLLAVPDADIPTVQVSLRRDLDAAFHLALGRALAPLREEGVLIVGSGMSYHNFGGFMRPAGDADSKAFDAWMQQTVGLDAEARDARLARWAESPKGRASHPREEHLLPLMVCAGAAGSDGGQTVFTDRVMGVTVSGVRFG
ncbi:MAG: dioxygenase [Alphaproteobacteria bacterium]|nr:dioxygenase [Alphaproteobacteria bacterium]